MRSPGAQKILVTFDVGCSASLQDCDGSYHCLMLEAQRKVNAMIGTADYGNGLDVEMRFQSVRLLERLLKEKVVGLVCIGG